MITRTKTQLINMALANLAQGLYSTLDTVKRAQVDLFFDPIFEEVARDFDWPWLTKIADLVKLEVNPNVEWANAYRLPPDCHFFRRILSGARTDDPDTYIPLRFLTEQANGAAAVAITSVTKATQAVVTKVNHGFEDGQLVLGAVSVGMTELDGNVYIVEVIDDDSFYIWDSSTGDYVDSTDYAVFSAGTFTLQASDIILTDLNNAQGEYTQKLTWTSGGNDISIRMPGDFANAFANRLASAMGPALTGGDKFKLSERNLAFYIQYMGPKARANSGNEEKADPRPLDGISRARMGGSRRGSTMPWAATRKGSQIF